MTTTIPSGLGGTLGLKAESTWGTEATVNRWFMIDPSESFQLKKIVDESKVLYGGLFQQSQRRALTGLEASGKFKMDLVDQGLGVIIANMIGSSATAVQQSSTTAYLQQHTPSPGYLLGKSLTIQKAVPEVPSGTLVPFTYSGCKITDWTLSCALQKIAQLEMSYDAKTEDASATLVAPSWTNANPFTWVGGALLLGGTASTSSGITSISSGAAPTGLISSVELKGVRKMNTKRFTLGSTTKNEQIENDYIEISGSCEIEFANKADYYTAMAADTPLCAQLTFTGPEIGTSGIDSYLQAIMPSIYWTETPVLISSMDVIKVKAPFAVRYDGTNNAIEIDYMSADTAI